MSTNNELVAVNNLIALADMPREEIKRQMDRSFLANLVRQHPSLDQSAFLEFITKCQLTGADPRLNQVYLLVHNSWNAEKRVTEPKGTTVFAYQYFIQLAQRTGELEEFGVDTYPDMYLDLVTGEERKSITSKAWVKRKGAGRFEYKARFPEFCKTNKEGKLMKNWAASPYLMLEKCSIANVMRWAFPEALSGIYTSEEISKDGSDPVPVQAPKPTQNQLPVAPKPITAYMAPTSCEPVPDAVSEHVAEVVAEKKEYKIDFADRTLEDLRSELIEFLEKADQLLFDRIGKTRDYMIEKVEFEKTLEGMKQKFSIVMRFM
jgi:phage recombination protein Bet